MYLSNSIISYPWTKLHFLSAITKTANIICSLLMLSVTNRQTLKTKSALVLFPNLLGIFFYLLFLSIIYIFIL